MKTMPFSTMLSAAWRAVGTATLALAAVAPLSLHAQSVVVSSQVEVSSDEAVLRIETDDGRTLRLSLADGRVLVDEAEVGSFRRDGILDRSWRGLLAQSVELGGSALTERLVQWEPPTDLDDQAEATARTLDEALETFLGSEATQPVEAAAIQAPQAPQSPTPPNGVSLRRLLGSRDFVRLVQALDREEIELDLDEVHAFIDEDGVVRTGERLEGTVLVIGGELEVRGEVDGDVVVSDGRVRLYDDGVIRGDVQTVDGRFQNLGGRLEGERNRIRMQSQTDIRELRDDLRDEIRRELEDEFRGSFEWSAHDRRSIFSPFRHFWSGLMGLFQNVMAFGILAGVGAVLLYFRSDRMVEIADTARASIPRAALVGVAGTFLFFPIWILGVVVLAISIIGIPALLLWVPFFPLLVGLAGLVGVFSVAMLVGEWVQERRLPWMEWADDANPFYRMVSGLLLVTALFAMANVLRMGGPMLGFFHGLVSMVACLTFTAMVVVGFGAVLLHWSERRARMRAAGFGTGSWRDWEASARAGFGRRRRSYGTGAAGAASAAADDLAEDIEDLAEDIEDAAEAPLDDVDSALDSMADVVDQGVQAARNIVDSLLGEDEPAAPEPVDPEDPASPADETQDGEAPEANGPTADDPADADEGELDSKDGRDA